MDNTQGPTSGRITSGLNPNTLILQTIDFVYSQLPAWRDDSNRQPEQAEDKLTDQLTKFLNSAPCRSAFPMVQFAREEPQSGRSRVDMAASPTESIIGATYTIYKPIVVFECKRLPAPSRDREREYVTGGAERQKGGIQRFKLGSHGADHDVAAMIGYIQEHSVRYWREEINKWIAELSTDATRDICVWNKSDTLGKLNENPEARTATCQSVHARSGDHLESDKISLNHLWVVMNR